MRVTKQTPRKSRQVVHDNVKKNVEDEKAIPAVEQVTAQVEIVEDNRDPKEINSHVQIHFEDVIGETEAAKSPTCVWTCSFKCYTFWRNICYRLLTLPCAICISTFYGCELARTAFCHVWITTPLLHMCHLTFFHCLRRMNRQFSSCCVEPIFFISGVLLGKFRNKGSGTNALLPRHRRLRVCFDDKVRTKRIPKIGRTPAKFARIKFLSSSFFNYR